MENSVAMKRWQDQLILLLGLWQFVTPWVFAYDLSSPLAWTAFVSGAVMAVLAAFDLYKTYFWAVVLNLIVGILVAISPWVLERTEGLAMTQTTLWNNLLVGVAVAVLALWEMRTDPELRTHWPGAAHP